MSITATYSVSESPPAPPSAPPPMIPRKTKYVAQGPGEDCSNCAKYWRVRGKAPRTLVEIAKGEYGTPIVACSWCDGPVVDMHLQRNG